MIRHSLKGKDAVRLKKLEEKDRQFLIEKIIYGVEKENPYTIEIEKKQKLCSKLKRITEFAGEFISPCF